MPLFVLPLAHSQTSGSHSSHGPTSPMTTSMRAIARHKRLQECHLRVDTSYKAHGVLDRVQAATIQTGHDMHMPAGLAIAWPTFCVVHVCRFCFIYFGLRFYAQSHSDSDHVHATAPCSVHALAQARPTMSYIPLVLFIGCKNLGRFYLSPIHDSINKLHVVTVLLSSSFSHESHRPSITTSMYLTHVFTQHCPKAIIVCNWYLSPIHDSMNIKLWSHFSACHTNHTLLYAPYTCMYTALPPKAISVHVENPAIC